jgi:hypothetical protein
MQGNDANQRGGNMSEVDRMVMSRVKKRVREVFPDKHEKQKNVFLNHSQTRAVFFCDREPKMGNNYGSLIGIDVKEIALLAQDMLSVVGPEQLVLYKITPKGPALFRIVCGIDSHYLKGLWFAIAPRIK